MKKLCMYTNSVKVLNPEQLAFDGVVIACNLESIRPWA